MQLSEAIPQYDRQMAANGRSAHTRAAYLRDLRALSRWLAEDSNVDSITPDTLARFLISDMVLCTPTGEPRVAISVNRTKSALRSFFAFCVESGFLRENPARLIRSSPARSKEPSTFEAGEIQRIRSVLAEKTGTLADRDRLIFELLLGTGIRLGSLVGLNRGDVDLEACTIHIQSKGGGRERVFLNAQLCGMLRHHLGESAPQGNTAPNSPVFPVEVRPSPRRAADPAQLRAVAGAGRHHPPVLDPLPEAHVCNSPVPEDGGFVPGAEGVGAQTNHHNRNLRQSLRRRSQASRHSRLNKGPAAHP